MHDKPHRRHSDRQSCTDCGAVDGAHAAGCVWDLSQTDVPQDELDQYDLEGFGLIAFGGQLLQEVRDAA